MKQYYIAICGILKNEAPYLVEWIEFHRLQGVAHFFLYDNESTDDTWKIMESYAQKGIATIEKVSGIGMQRATYSKCLADHGSKTQWLAFLDCDEFLYATDKLFKYLPEYVEYGAVAVNWVLYGSNGKLTQEPGLVIERFTKRAAHADRHVKSIVQPHLTISPGNNAHYFILKEPAVNELKDIQPPEYYWTRPSILRFRINHYHVKSLEEYRKRKSYIDVDNVDRGDVEERFKGHDVNDVVDLSALKFVSKIKERC